MDENRQCLHHLSKEGSTSPFWTWDHVEGRLIEAMQLAWRDEPGRWPFAGDGPWHLIQRSVAAGDYDARGGEMDTPPPRRLPLTRAERARLEQAQGWLGALSEGDRRLCLLVLRKKASDRAVRWAELLRPMRMRRGAGQLERRYRGAIGALAARLHAAGVPVVLSGGALSGG